MTDPLDRVLEEEPDYIESFVQNQVESLLKRTRNQAQVDVQQDGREQDDETDVDEL